MTEVEVQQRAKRYLDCLVQGINPLDGTIPYRPFRAS